MPPEIYDPIAIIGIGCRFPGGVHDLKSFWQLLTEGVDAIQEIPADRFDLKAFYDPRPATPGKVMTRWGGFLDRIDEFDAPFFGISPREAEQMDPQQRLLLEVAWEALENAGQASERLRGSQTGVFIGQWLSDFEARLFADPDHVGFFMTTGSGRYAASGRISYAFGLEGPSLTVDTACSSSLVAVHLACQSLRHGESRLALAGAANIILQPHITIAYSQSKMMAPDGRCKFGDARANGYVRSEGAAAIVLKRLPDALADGDPIQAVILGSAVNNDGQSSGYLSTPGAAGQEAVLRQAYRSAGISPGQVQYVEAHGTGTSAGDPVEIEALDHVLAEGRPADSPCLVGSVKTNIGHTESAAGLAGLIKVVLSLKHQTIPASLHFQSPNPNIPWEKLRISVQHELGAWPAHAGLALAGVSAFGITGTNAHVVLQELPRSQPKPAAQSASRHASYLLPLSARTPEALRARTQSFRDYLAQNDLALTDVAYTAAALRQHDDHRLALIGNSKDQLMEAMTGFLAGENRPTVISGQAGKPGKVVFIFPGQGSQWLGMGRLLMEREPAFCQLIEQCEEAMRPYVTWSLREQLQADESHSRLNEIDVIQPTLFAIEVALAALWRAWGVQPDAVVGHSLGEVAAAAVSGAISLDDGARIICHRSRLMRQVSGKGAMTAVELTLDQARQALAGYEDQVSIAVSNGPRSTVLSGDPEALGRITAELERRQVFCRAVKVDVAAHSPHMEALRPQLVQLLAGLQAHSPLTPIYSTVTGKRVDFFLEAEYWGRNLREPVLFATAVQRLLADGFNTFIEMSPHPILLPAIEQGSQSEILTLPSMRRQEDEQLVMLTSLSRLYTQGYPMDWRCFYPAGQCVDLPPYPWQRERLWAKEAEPGRPTTRAPRRLLEPPIEPAFRAGSHLWQTVLSLEAYPYLADHRVQGAVVFPAAAYIELVLEAAADIHGPGPHMVERVDFKETLVLKEDQPPTIQVILSPGGEFEVVSRSQADWTRHATGLLRRAGPAEIPAHEPPKVIAARCPDARTGADHYHAMTARGVAYGPAFQGVLGWRRAEAELLGQIHLPALLSPGDLVIHPALLDACFQLIVATQPDSVAEGDTYLPVKLDRLQVFSRPAGEAELWAHAVRTRLPEAPETLTGDLTLVDEHGQVVLAAHGLHLQRFSGARRSDLASWFYTIRWQAAEPPPAPKDARPFRWLLLADKIDTLSGLAARLSDHGGEVVRVLSGSCYETLADGLYQIDPAQRADWTRLLGKAFSGQGSQGIVFLAGASTPDTPASAEALCVSVLHMIQAVTRSGLAQMPRLWLVTSGAQPVRPQDPPVSAAQMALWGLGAVIEHELPELDSTRLDLSGDGSAGETEALVRELLSGSTDDQVALRGETRYVPRLTRLTLPEAPQAEQPYRAAQPAPAFRVESTMPGLLDHLILRAFSRQKPGPGQVEIEVEATGLNFMNVMSALGICPGYEGGLGPLGIECAGHIAAVGEGVTHPRVGEAVVGIAFHSLGTHALTDARLVRPKPAHLSFEQAVTIPVAYLTAYYALCHLGRLSRGEKVLIHAATGGVGLAAIQVARHAGAEVFATAGSPEKRRYLQELGITHVMDSRSLDFADEVLAATGGRGVDLVLNSLAGEGIARSLACLAPYGRFLEIGKRDIYQNTALGLAPFQKSLSYFAIDLDRLSRERPDLVGQLLQQVISHVEAGAYQPLRLQVFQVAEVEEAFRHMAQARHIGKIVVSLAGRDVPVAPSLESLAPVKADGTYLITGGLGGLGLAVARWLVQNGGRHLALVGRSGAAGLAPAAREALADLENAGARVLVAQADVAQEDQVAAVLAQIDRDWPPLRGIVHAAGVLDDGVLLQQDAERFRAVMTPKVRGAWHLHQLSAGKPLDFFVAFSSIASAFGSPGQGNYAAANAYLDGLAHQRRALGLPALSLNWGPWTTIGLAARRQEGGLQGLQGVGTLSPENGVLAFGHCLEMAETQIIVSPLDARRWVEAHRAAARSPLFTQLLAEGGGVAEASVSAAAVPLRDRLLAAQAGRERRALLETYIQEQAAQVLRLAPARVDLHKPLRTLGMDSLMSIEFRNRLEGGMGLSLSATLVWNYPTVSELAPHLAERMGISLSDDQTPVEATSGLDQLSEAELEAQLADELKAADDLLKGQ